MAVVGWKFPPEVRDTYLRLISQGRSKRAAALACGVTPQAVAYHRKHDSAFDADVEECSRFAREAVEEVLYDRAMEGDSWAVKFYLAAEDPDKYGTSRSVSVSVRGEFGGDQSIPLMERVRMVRQEIEAREGALELAPGAVEDAVVVE